MLAFRRRCDAGYRLERVKVDEEGGASGFRCREHAARCVHVILRYIDSNHLVRLRAESNGRIEYEELIDGTWSKPLAVGNAPACDGRWHAWEITLNGPENRVTIDGRAVGTARSSPALVNHGGLRFGFSVRDTFVSVDDIRMTRRHSPEPTATKESAPQ